MDDLTKLPNEFLPAIDDLPGELPDLARTIEALFPGLGVRVTLALEQRYRGTPVYFHNADGIRRRVRNQRIIERYSSGERADDIARSVGMSSRQIWNILGEVPGVDDNRQMKLFG
jgi:Mor family transcriptional regulator